MRENRDPTRVARQKSLLNSSVTCAQSTYNPMELRLPCGKYGMRLQSSSQVGGWKFCKPSEAFLSIIPPNPPPKKTHSVLQRDLPY